MKKKSLFNDTYKKAIDNSLYDGLYIQNIIEEGFLRTIGNVFRRNESIKTSSESMAISILRKIGFAINIDKINKVDVYKLVKQMHANVNFGEDFHHYVFIDKRIDKIIVNLRAHVAYKSETKIDSDVDIIGMIVLELFDGNNNFIEGTDGITIRKSDDESEIEKRIMFALKNRHCEKLATVMAKCSNSFKGLASKNSISCNDKEMNEVELLNVDEMHDKLEKIKAEKENAAKEEDNKNTTSSGPDNSTNHNNHINIDLSNDESDEVLSNADKKRIARLIELYKENAKIINRIYVNLTKNFGEIINFINEIPNNKNAFKIYVETRQQLKNYRNDGRTPEQCSELNKIIKFIEVSYLLKNMTDIDGTIQNGAESEEYSHHISLDKFGYDFLDEEFNLVTEYHKHDNYDHEENDVNKFKLFRLILKCEAAFKDIYNGMKAIMNFEVNTKTVLEPHKIINYGSILNVFEDEIETCYDKLEDIFTEGVFSNSKNKFHEIAKTVRSLTK